MGVSGYNGGRVKRKRKEIEMPEVKIIEEPICLTNSFEDNIKSSKEIKRLKNEISKLIKEKCALKDRADALEEETRVLDARNKIVMHECDLLSEMFNKEVKISIRTSILFMALFFITLIVELLHQVGVL